MRNYLYIWADKERNYIVASGIEFLDIAPFIENIILLKHRYAEAEVDLSTKLEYTSKENIIQDNPYEYGDFCWVDFYGNTIGELDRNSIASLLYFAHTKEPFDKVLHKIIQNKFLCYSHDDGWYLKLYYSKWSDIVPIIDNKIYSLDAGKYEITKNILENKMAHFVKDGKVIECEATFDIDRILNKLMD